MRIADRFFALAFLAFSGLELVSLAAFGGAIPSWLWLAGIGLAVVWATTQNAAWGVYAVLGELFVGGKGYLLAVPVGGAVLSLRMVIFLAVLGTWLAKFCTQAAVQGLHRPKILRLHFAPLGLTLALAIGGTSGLVRYPFHQVFYDGNAWLFFLLLPVIVAAMQTPRHVQRVRQLLLAATVVVGLKTALLLFLFGHFPQDFLAGVYRWVRDTGVGEITPVTGSLFRVFFQSHVFSMVAWLVVLHMLVQRTLRHRADILLACAGLYLASLTLLISQSRSLWIGALAGLAVLLIAAVKNYRVKTGRAVLVLLLLGYVISTQISAVTLLSGNYGGNIFRDRFSNINNEPAASSRKSQLAPLLDATGQRPLLGWGFGKQLRYQSQDPRIVRQHPNGWYTTSAFEWGYLDIALKIGLLGLAAYLGWIIQVAVAGLRHQEGREAVAGITVGLIAIAVTSIFSPYLNHPLGIGWLAFTVAAVTVAKTPLPKPAAGK